MLRVRRGGNHGARGGNGGVVEVPAGILQISAKSEVIGNVARRLDFEARSCWGLERAISAVGPSGCDAKSLQRIVRRNGGIDIGSLLRAGVVGIEGHRQVVVPVGQASADKAQL